MPSPETPRARRRLRSGVVWRRAVLAVGGLLVAVAAHQVATWPDVSALREANPATTSFIRRWQAEQSRQGKSDAVRQAWVPYGRISGRLKRAILVAEDINFFDHDGFEAYELKQAMREAIRQRRPPRGASTLTQQLAKNIWLSPSRNPLRKVKEALLTRQLEEALEKRRIFELYLNLVEFGPGIYGAEAASRHYFGCAASTLTEGQAAALAAALPSPRRWHPRSNSPAYRQRVDRIRQRMRRAAWLRRVI